MLQHALRAPNFPTTFRLSIAMKTIRLQNFRSLVNTESVSILPITVLLGQNSSGKSTLVRSLPLLKQGLGVRTQGPFLWLGHLVDFGSFEETVSTFSEATSIAVELEFDISLNVNARHRPEYPTEPVKLSIAEYRSSINSPPIFQYALKVSNDIISFSVENDTFTNLSINGNDYSRLIRDRYEIKQWSGPVPNATLIANETLTPNTQPSFQTEILSLLRALSHGKTASERLMDLRRVLVGAPLNLLLQVLKSTSYGDTQWKKNTNSWTEEHLIFKKLRELTIGARLFSSLSIVSDYLSSFLYNTRYIKPLRASAERYYRKQGLAVDELDPEGDNFALFIQNMTPSEKSNFRDWSEKYFGIGIDVKESAGHLSLVLMSKKTPAQSFNMADAGFGYSQMFPILAQLWAIRRRTRNNSPKRIRIPFVFSIEQPELHLHPRLQAKLADVFVSAISAAREIEIDLRLIIETHSEYFVNRLGYLVSTGTLESSDASILIFEKDDPSCPTRIRRAFFSDKGYLENWPFGFFEPESDNQ